MPLICNTGHANLIWPFVAWFGSTQVAKSKSTLLELGMLKIKARFIYFDTEISVIRRIETVHSIIEFSVRPITEISVSK